ncbi:pleiotropic drug resistance protein 1 isoform X1 [Selaginella moellendorffii]|uniref:pleiotropic drug resistance protein 1 isoform X1 n=1 Tax=Selaginella moellendorffii TaxID=88036 RepID=UPI000D1C23F0|nr:pleiotropic drug resistance protein 1 isoform X1 [Selaginella moellendorffii]|eukprot:XP_024544542.1 pleiotropic drug resistance protein 1 isoform X1 [Selaginella moellendorffii]
MDSSAGSIFLVKGSSLRSMSRGSSVFSIESGREYDEEDAFKWASLEKLPTYNRMRTALLPSPADDDEAGKFKHNEIDVTRLQGQERRILVQRIFRVAERDNERMLRKLRERIDLVGIQLPRIEVRFENLSLEASVHIGRRALPTLYNFTIDAIESILQILNLSFSKKKQLHILRDVSGVIKPSRMTLLLGPPSSGKTSLLLALAGRLDPSLKVRGKVTYNGHDMTEFVPHKTSAYISQHDLHTAEMTVRETLDFSGRCQGVGTRYEMLSELSRRELMMRVKPDAELDAFLKATVVEGQETNIVTDYVLKILALDLCADAMVGDNMRRGISGGQKKRLTTGEMLVGPARALFMDEISTGLDSSTTFQIVKCLRQTVHLMDATMLVSLLQPAPETFELFDDVILLSEGRIVYQGPRERVLDFFAMMGFKCPQRKGVADFLQEVTSLKDQQQYWADRTQPYQYVSVDEFAEAFSKFSVGHQLSQDLAVPFDKSSSHPGALVTYNHALSNWELLRACLSREALLMKRNSFVYIFKTVQFAITACIAMTVFLRTKMHHSTVGDANIYMGALFFGVLAVMFNGLAELVMTVERLPVFYKQRDLMFYPAWAYSLPYIVLRIPLSVIEPAIWVLLSYWVIGFAPEATRVLQHFIVLVFAHLMSGGLFRSLAALGRTRVVANTFGSFALLIIFVMGGFVLSRDNIPSWWTWAYWTSPMMYAQNAISVNEFEAERWQKPVLNSTGSIGTEILHARGLFSSSSWLWIGIGALFGFSILLNAIFVLAMTYLRAPGKPQAAVLEEETTNATISRRYSGKSSNRYSHSRGIEMSIRDAEDIESGGISKRGMVLPFQPLALSFHHVNYYVDLPSAMKQPDADTQRLQLLRDVSGSFRPGVLTALVGVSGAGKTTLMDVLAGRKTGGYIEGDIRISGYTKKQETFARVAGYCEQTDIHSPNVTVYESLVFSAWLRLPRVVDRKTREMFLEEVMELVELTPLKDALVGFPGVDGLSTEQRKRLTIAVELVANPSIIFMDEPTTGLDARAAAIVMRTVRNTVNTGRTVVCTIHQPSIDIFEAFDELLLMKYGGRIIYAGPLGQNSQKLTDYFQVSIFIHIQCYSTLYITLQALEGVPRIKEGYNPATWMLEVTSATVESQIGVDFAEHYRNSSLYQRNEAMIKELSAPAPGSSDLEFSSTFARSFTEQCVACLWKQQWSYWRNPTYCAVRLFYTLACALLFGSMFWRLGSNRNNQQDILNLLGFFYAGVLGIGLNNASTVQSVVEIERVVYYREKAAGLYSAFSYVIAQVIIELPHVFLQAVLHVAITYPAVNLEWTAAKFMWNLFFVYFSFLIFTFYGMMAVAITPNEQIAAVISSAFYLVWNLFSGMVIPYKKIPVWWRWYYWANPIAWSLYGLLTSQLGDVETLIAVPGVGMQSVKSFLEDYFGFHHDFLGVVAAAHVGIVILCISVFALGIKHLNFQNR